MSTPTMPPVVVAEIATPTRPAGVFAAAYLLCGAAAFWLSATIATLFAVPQYSRHYADLRQDADAAPLVAFLLLGAAAVGLAGVGVATLLALLDARGRSAARVLTWVLAGVAGLVAGSILLADLFVAISWHRWLMTTTAALTLVFVPATVVLLALPSSGSYFRAIRQARLARQAVARFARRPFASPYFGPGYPPPPTSHYPPPPPPTSHYPPPPPPQEQPEREET